MTGISKSVTLAEDEKRLKRVVLLERAETNRKLTDLIRIPKSKLAIENGSANADDGDDKKLKDEKLIEDKKDEDVVKIDEGGDDDKSNGVEEEKDGKEKEKGDDGEDKEGDKEKEDAVKEEEKNDTKKELENEEKKVTDKEKEKDEEDDDDDVDDNSIDSLDSDSLLGSSIDEDDEDEDDDNDKDDANNVWDSDNEDVEWKPGKQKTVSYEPEGPLGRLLRAVNESDFPPIRADWTNYITDMALERSLASGIGSESKLRKVEQLDMASNRVIQMFAGVNAASRHTGIPLHSINAVLQNKTDTAGGFKWRLASGTSSTGQEIGVGDDFDDEEDETKKEESWKLKLPDPDKSRDYKNGGTLRDYQIEGLTWLLRCWYTKRSSILADEMGLGKTVQVVTFLDHLFEVEQIRGPFLIAVPLSTIEHWRREFEGWSNMTVCLYHDTGGGRDMRDVIREYEWHYKGRSRRLLKFHVLITTYDDLIRDYEELAEVPWRAVIVDEAHRLKNTGSKLLDCMRAVVAKGMTAYGYQHRVLMTGTPLQNNTGEDCTCTYNCYSDCIALISLPLHHRYCLLNYLSHTHHTHTLTTYYTHILTHSYKHYLCHSPTHNLLHYLHSLSL
jgi:SNF2-related domain